MAKFPNGINGPFSGGIGPIVGVIDGKKNYGRSKPKKVNPAKITIAQKTQTNKTKVLSSFLKPLKEFFKISYQQKGIELDINPASAVRSECLKNGVKGKYPNQEIDWDHILVSSGSRAIPENVSVNVIAGGFELTWDKNYDTSNGSDKDRTMMVLYSEDSPDSAIVEYSGARRSSLTDEISVPKRYKGESFHVFLAFKEVKTNIVSRSVYCGKHFFEG